MSAPTTDRGGIEQAIRALRAAGWELAYVDDGGENIPVKTEPEAIDAIMAVDQAWLHFTKGEPELDKKLHKTGWLFFVLGNDPDEVICDYTTNLDPTIEDLTRGWW